jgi:hypothetical protein
MEDVGTIYGHLVYFTAIGNILWPFGIPSLWSIGIFLPVLVFCTTKNLAALARTGRVLLRADVDAGIDLLFFLLFVSSTVGDF